MFSNKAITVPVLAWFVAQVLKCALVLIKEKKLDFTRFTGSGGMPSSHSAFVVSLAAIIGKTYGWNSGVFAISSAVALIVMYDAAGVRRAAGRQAEVLNKLIVTHEEINVNEELKELLGHTPLQVLAGAALGILLGLLV